MKKGISLFVCILFSLSLFAQKNFWKEAEKKYATFEYFAAIDLYKAAYKQAKKPLKPECLWKIAECYRLINDVKQAELNYEKAIKANCKNTPLATLYMADMMKQGEKYPEALAQYQKYASLVPSDKRGENGAKSCELAQKWKDNPTRYKVENMVQINTKEWDYCPMYLERKKYTTLLFSSTRQGATGDVDGNVGQLFADIFMTQIDKNGKWSTPTPLSSPLSTKENEAACVTLRGAINELEDKVEEINGPGNLTKYLGITTENKDEYDGISIYGTKVWIKGKPLYEFKIRKLKGNSPNCKGIYTIL